MSKSGRTREFLTQPAVLDFKQPHPRRLIHDVQQLGRIEWLSKNPKRRASPLPKRRAFRIAAGNHYNLKRRILCACDIDQCQTFGDVVYVRRQVQIANHYFNLFVVDQRARFVSRRRLQHLIVRRQRPIESTTHRVVVVDN